MKNLTFKILIISLNLFLKPINTIDGNPVQCLLSMSVKEYYYQHLSNTVELILNFKSNCLPFSFPIYFELPWDTFYYLDNIDHPRKVELYILGKNYTLDFSKPLKQTYGEEGESYKLIYNSFKISPSHYADQEFVMYKHNYFIVMNKDDGYDFEKKVLEDFWNIDNPVYCNADDKSLLVCDIPLID